MKIKICKYCIQPDTRPNVYFNEEGICGACLWEKEKETIDWDNREKELQEIADNAKQNTTSNWRWSWYASNRCHGTGVKR